ATCRQRGHQTILDGKGRRIALKLGALVAGFSLKTEHAEIVADQAIDVVAGLEVGSRSVVRLNPGWVSDIEVNILDNHATAFNTHVPRIVAGHGWRGECRRSEHSH